MHRLATSCAVAVVTLSACAAGPECAATSDCGFGSVCQEEQRIAAGVSSSGGGAGLAGGGAGDGVIPQVGNPYEAPTVLSIPATLVGTIGGTPLSATATTAAAGELIGSETGELYIRIADPTLNSTFVVLASVTREDLETVGTSTVGDGTMNDPTYGQACNYDQSAYDEFFPSVELTVSAPRAPTEDEDFGVDVVDIGFTITGTGTDVAATAVVPVAW